MAAVTLAARRGPVERTLGILELVAERGGASARELSAAPGLPLPTVYRLAKELVDTDYLVHIRSESRYELGYKLHRLGLSLHRQVGLSRALTDEIGRLHESTGFAAYLSILRGAELVIVHVVDSPDCPRLQPCASASTRPRTPPPSGRSCWPTCPPRSATCTSPGTGCGR